MSEKTILSQKDIDRILTRLAHEIIERNGGCENLIIVGIYTRGVPLAWRLVNRIKGLSGIDIPVGVLDISSHRDDISSEDIQPVDGRTDIPARITGKHVILVDDVIYTGRSIRAAMDALINLGRPQRIQLAVLVDRGHRELPIRADYVGKNIPTSQHENVSVRLEEIDGKDEVVIANMAGEKYQGNRISLEALS